MADPNNFPFPIIGNLQPFPPNPVPVQANLPPPPTPSFYTQFPPTPTNISDTAALSLLSCQQPDPQAILLHQQQNQILTTTEENPDMFTAPTKVKKKKRKAKIKPISMDQGSGSKSGLGNQGSKIKNYVLQLLESRKDGFPDRDFAERALSNLARKLSSQPLMMAEWLKAIQTGDSNTDCVKVTRPKDGRMTVSKAPGNSGCKKVFPQILVCQVFRWPHIVFHHDIKSTEGCGTPASIKPAGAALATTSGGASATEQVPVDDSDVVICVNPYHYAITPEAEVRFKKQARSNPGSGSGKSSSLITSASSSLTAEDSCQSILTNEDENENSSESDDDDDEDILEFDDEGVDYIKMWEDNKGDQNNSALVQDMTEDKLLEEMKFFTLNSRKKDFEPAEKQVLEHVYAEIKKVILSGDYLKRIVSKDQDKNEVETKKDVVEVIETSPTNFASRISDKTLGSVVVETGVEDDSAIQDLLDDIRGSFERQFDDEFNDENHHHQESAFGNIESAFSINQNEAPLSIDAIDIDPRNHVFSEENRTNDDEEMPCIVGAWSMPNNSGGNNEEFLSAGTISQEEFDNFFQASNTDDQQQQQQQQFQYPQQYNSSGTNYHQPF